MCNAISVCIRKKGFNRFIMKLLSIITIGMIMICGSAVAGSIRLEVTRGETFSDDEMASMCNEALMHGNLMKISGEVWQSGNGNLEFISFHQGRVFNFFGYSKDLHCSVTINGAGAIEPKGSGLRRLREEMLK